MHCSRTRPTPSAWRAARRPIWRITSPPRSSATTSRRPTTQCSAANHATKFWSMRQSRDGPEVTAPGDERVTRVGRSLRRAGLDELPQLVNILRGEMTLVGPRPETPALAIRYPTECKVVFRYRPGLTGPAQV